MTQLMLGKSLITGQNKWWPLTVMFSAAKNLSKSGFKSPNFQEESAGEQELATWLQQPPEDALVKTYRSDMFGKWPSSPPTMAATKSTAKVSPPFSTPTSMESGRLFTATKTFVRPQLRSGNAVAIMDGSNSDEQARIFDESSMLNRTDSVDGALTLGAKRAAGLDMSPGRHAFSKVRLTSFQTPHTDTNTSSGNGHPYVSRRYNVPGMASNFGNSHPAAHAVAKPSLGNHVSWPMFHPRCQISKSNPTGLGLERLSESAHLQSPNAKHTEHIHVAPNATAQSSSAHGHDRIATKHQQSPDNSGVRLIYHNPLAEETQGSCHERVDKCPEEMQLQSSNIQQTECNEIIPSSNAQSASSHQRNTSKHHQAVQECGETPPSPCSGSGSQASAEFSVRDMKIVGKRQHQGSECQSEDADDESMEIKQPRKQCSTSKRNRAAEVHNLSEKNRRNRINEKLRALQELIPNSTKTDKASVLDEAIEYMKTLQMQLQMVSMRNAMDMSQMMMPMSMPHLQISPLPTMGFGVPIGHAGMGMGIGMGLLDLSQNMMSRPFHSVPTAVNSHPGIPFQDGVVISTTTTHAEPRQAFGRTDISEHASQLSQNSSQISGQMHLMSHTLTPSSHGLQNEQGQHLHHSRGHGNRD